MLQRLIGEIPRFFSWQNLVLLGEAMGITLAMTLIGCVLGFLFAFAIAFTRQFRGLPFLPLRIAAILFVETFRRIPFLVVLFLVLFSIQAVHSGTSLFSVAVVSICIYSTAYIRHNSRRLRVGSAPSDRSRLRDELQPLASA